eukprot:3120493-Amphidinium_carterae.1
MPLSRVRAGGVGSANLGEGLHALPEASRTNTWTVGQCFRTQPLSQRSGGAWLHQRPLQQKLAYRASGDCKPHKAEAPSKSAECHSL